MYLKYQKIIYNFLWINHMTHLYDNFPPHPLTSYSLNPSSYGNDLYNILCRNSNSPATSLYPASKNMK